MIRIYDCQIRKPRLMDVFERWDPVNGGEIEVNGASAITGATTGIAGGIAGGALAGAVGGATGGSIVPGVGTAIGGIAGTFVGLGAAAFGLGNTGFDLVERNGEILFVPGSGSFYRYNNESGNNKDLVSHIFWDKTSGDVYYLNPNNNKYLKLDTTGLDMTGGFFNYASDDLLDRASNAIAKIIRDERLNNATLKLFEQYTEELNSEGLGVISSIAIPSSDFISEEQLAEYSNRKLKAELSLRKLLVPDFGDIETPDDKTYYKYGSNEIDLKYYLYNLGTNLLAYIKSLGWNETERQAFIDTFEQYKLGLLEQLDGNTNRFSTSDTGDLIDSEGVLNSTEAIIEDANGQTYASLEDIQDKKLRKTARIFKPGEAVKNYLNTIGQAIVNSGKTKNTSTEDLGDFDITKNGFLNYWLNKNNPAGGQPDLAPYLALDPVGPDGKREKTNRTKYLAYELANYANRVFLSKKDFSKTPYKTKENYLAKIRQAIINLNNGWDESDPLSLNEIGITPDFYSVFMTELSNPLATPEELALELLQKKEEAASDYIEKILRAYELYAKYSGLRTFDNDPANFIYDARYDNNNPGASTAIGTALQNLGFPADADNIALTVQYLWNQIKLALRLGVHIIKTNLGYELIEDILPIILPMYLNSPDYFKDSTKAIGVKFLDDPELDIKNGAILCYKEGKLYYDFIGNVKDCTAWQLLKLKFELGYVPKDSAKPKLSFDKLGGVIKKLQEGSQLNPENFDEETLLLLEQLAALTKNQGNENLSVPLNVVAPIKKDGSFLVSAGQSPGAALALTLYGDRIAAALARNMSYERYNSKQRKMNAAPDFYNKDNGYWKTEDYLRLGAIAADIASLIMDPITGAVTNVGSTATNFMADWADGTVTTGEMWKNLAMNLGMDALSIVPIVGDAAGTGGKLVKAVKNIAPKLAYALTAWGVLGTLKNGANIAESLNKVMSDEKLTVGDWQNIAQAITALAGVNGALKAGAAKKIAKRTSVENDAIGLGLRKKIGDVVGKSLDYIFRGEKAKKLRELVAEGNPEKVNRYLLTFEGFEDFIVNTSLSTTPIGAHSPIGRTTNADGTKSWEVRSPLGVNKKIDFFDLYNYDKLQNQGYRSRNLLNTRRLDAVLPGRLLSDIDLMPLSEVIARLKKAVTDAATAAGAILASQKRTALELATAEKVTAVEQEKANVVVQLLEKTAARLAKELELANAENTSEISKLIDAAKRKLTALKRNKPKKPRNIGKGKSNWQNQVNAENDKIANLENLLKEINTKIKNNDEIKQLAKEEQGLLDAISKYDSDLATLRTRLLRLSDKNIISYKTLKFLDDWASKNYRMLLDNDPLTAFNAKPMIEELNLWRKGGVIKAHNGVKLNSSNGEPLPLQMPEDVTDAENLEIPGATRHYNFKELVPGALAGIRYKLLDRANTRNAKKAIAAEPTFYQNPEVDYTLVKSELPSEILAQLTYAKMTRPGETAVTSDGAQQLAYKAQLHTNAAKQALALILESNKMYRTTLLVDQLQRKENHAKEHSVAELNKLSAIKTLQNKEKIRKALASQRANDLDVYLLGIEHDLKTQIKEAKSARDAAALSRILVAVKNDPNNFGAGLSDSELALYNRIRSGIAPSTLSDEEKTLLSTIYGKISLAAQNTYYEYMGAGANPWLGEPSVYPLLSAPRPYSVVLSSTPYKDGGKLATAKIRNKAKNADRFAKSVQKQLDSLDKKLDRISRSMYGLPKSEIVKSK